MGKLFVMLFLLVPTCKQHNKWLHRKVLLHSYHLNDYTKCFHLYTQKECTTKFNLKEKGVISPTKLHNTKKNVNIPVYWIHF